MRPLMRSRAVWKSTSELGYHGDESRRWPGNFTPSSRHSYGENIASMAWGTRNLISAQAYEPAPAGVLDAFDALPAGFDVLHGAAAREAFPCLSDDIVGVVHARRAGWVDSGRYAAELVGRAKAAGVTFLAGCVDGVELCGNHAVS